MRIIRAADLSCLVIVTILAVPASAQQSSCYLSYDGMDDRTFVPYQSGFPGQVFSVTAWIRTEDTKLQVIVSRGEDDVTDVLPWGVGLTGGRVYVQIEETGNVSPPLLISSSTINDGLWHHVAATRDVAGTVVIFVDGLVDSSFFGTPTPGSSTEDLGLGFSYQSSGTVGPQPPMLFFHGDLDEITMWSAALSASDVEDIRLHTLPATTTGLRGHWRFNEGTGQVAGDTSGNGMDATLGTSAAADSTDPVWCLPATGVENKFPMPVRTVLHQNYPNPFNPSTVIRYGLARRGWVTLQVFDVHGRLVRLLENGERASGPHDLRWDGMTDAGARATTGVYFYRLTVPDVTYTRRMVLLK